MILEATKYKGIQTGISEEGVQVIRIHYSADPEKDPDTKKGAAWVQRELQGYRGKTDPRWRKEMEIDFDAHGGQLLFPYLLENEHSIFVDPYTVNGLTLCAGLDYGTRNPSAFEVLAVDYDGNIQVIWEYYEPIKQPKESDEQFRARKGYKSLSKAIKSCPYFSRDLVIYADPSMFNKTQESSDPKGVKSMADLFVQEGVFLSRGQRGRDFTCYEKLNSKSWKDPEKPRLTIMKTCKWLWWELQRLRFADYSATVMASNNLQEKIVDKDNHAWDSLKYALMQIPAFTDIPAEKKASHDQRIENMMKGSTSQFEDYVKSQETPIVGVFNWGEQEEYDDGELYATM